MKTSKRGRPSLADDNGATPVVSVRLTARVIEAVDRWRARQGGEINRNQAIRFLTEFALLIDPDMPESERKRGKATR
jgi:hypothetical protein